MGQLIPIEQPPFDTKEDLSSYLVRQLVNINAALDSSSSLDILTTTPIKPVVGKIYYFKNAVPSTAITSEGFWGYTTTGYKKMSA